MKMLGMQKGGVLDTKKVKLLIIDPQNSFLPKKEGIRDDDGSLAVQGANEDTQRTIAFINKNKDIIDEIHVSLDTHTPRHIGHPGFWSKKSGEEFVSLDDGDIFIPLKFQDGKILSILPKYVGTEFMPLKYGDMTQEEHKKLVEYTKRYIAKFTEQEVAQTGLRPMIWAEHCIIGNKNHAIADELERTLNSFKEQGKTVKYIQKGLGNLAEMYSIFSAIHPFDQEEDAALVKFHQVGSENKNGNYVKASGSDSYEELLNCKNLDTKLNRDLLAELCKDNPIIFVCGQARTHCVKTSMLDLMEYAKVESTGTIIILLEDASSPIVMEGVIDDLMVRVEGAGYFVSNTTAEINSTVSAAASIRMVEQDGHVPEKLTAAASIPWDEPHEHVPEKLRDEERVPEKLRDEEHLSKKLRSDPTSP
jgi:nicotinamidase-related amidase